MIASHDANEASRLLAECPGLARQSLRAGASRAESTTNYFKEIEHYVYAGDTALHVAAAAYECSLVRDLLARGASPRAKNRRGAEPLHYATDGNPMSAAWNPVAQQGVVEILIDGGADPNSVDKGGVTPLHRVVRTRCASAVRALLANGADPLPKNKSGSTPLHLAVQTTGRGGSGSVQARDLQKEIIGLLLQYGARPTDEDSNGETVLQSATSDWIRELLRDPG
jgi:ankyrin repeat protein